MSKKYWIYHKIQCPLGKIVEEEEYEGLLRKGWVKNPNDFKKIVKPEKSKDLDPQDPIDNVANVPRGENLEKEIPELIPAAPSEE